MTEAGSEARRGNLTAFRIVCLVMATAAPLAVVVSGVPVMFALGTGAGAPVGFLAVGALILCFCAGYAAMSRKIVDTGAFSSYIGAAFGPVLKAAAASIAILCYSALSIGAVAVFSYFAHSVVLTELDLAIEWPWFAAVALIILFVLGRLRIDVSAKALAALMIAEVGILVITCIAVVVSKGVAAFPAETFDPSVALGPGLGITLILVVGGFMGFEASAVYGEEARDPRRTVARAAYASVVTILVFYGVTSWILVGAVGADEMESLSGQVLSRLVFDINTQYTASWLTTVMSVFLCTGMLASAIAAHNATSRYVYTLGRDGLLPRAFGRVHPKNGSPYFASTAQVALGATVLAIAGLAGLNPYLNVALSFVGLATLGVVVLMAATSAAVVVYFRRNRVGAHWWNSLVGPLVAGIGFAVTLALMLDNYAILSGTDSTVVQQLPWLIVIVAVVGGVRATQLQRSGRAAHAPDVLPEVLTSIRQDPGE